MGLVCKILRPGACSSRKCSHLQRHAARRRLVTKHAVALVISVASQVVGLRRRARRRVEDRSLQLEEVERVEAAASGVRVTRAREVACSPAVAEVDVGCAPTLCTGGGKSREGTAAAKYSDKNGNESKAFIT